VAWRLVVRGGHRAPGSLLLPTGLARIRPRHRLPLPGRSEEVAVLQKSRILQNSMMTYLVLIDLCLVLDPTCLRIVYFCVCAIYLKFQIDRWYFEATS
jgi:hypothetical protein